MANIMHNGKVNNFNMAPFQQSSKIFSLQNASRNNEATFNTCTIHGLCKTITELLDDQKLGSYILYIYNIILYSFMKCLN